MDLGPAWRQARAGRHGRPLDGRRAAGQVRRQREVGGAALRLRRQGAALLHRVRRSVQSRARAADRAGAIAALALRR
eukprot:4071893-Prymnesium_polylepis.1